MLPHGLSKDHLGNLCGVLKRVLDHFQGPKTKIGGNLRRIKLVVHHTVHEAMAKAKELNESGCKSGSSSNSCIGVREVWPWAASSTPVSSS